MTKEEAQQFKERWRLVNEFIADELRRDPPTYKLQQLALMYETAHVMGWVEGLRIGEDEVRERWWRLKEASGV